MTFGISAVYVSAKILYALLLADYHILQDLISLKQAGKLPENVAMQVEAIHSDLEMIVRIDKAKLIDYVNGPVPEGYLPTPTTQNGTWTNTSTSTVP